jgi:uncharacterized RDD family membrane protein YckC
MEVVNPSPAGRDLLGDLNEIVVPDYASQGQRFANYLIDWIASFALLAGFAFLTGLLINLDLVGESGEDWFKGPLSYITGSITAILYYTVTEGCFKGHTLGKLITGTYAVNNDGQPLTMKKALLRSLCRLIPFEVFSGLGAAPWHDSLTDTTVVRR